MPVEPATQVIDSVGILACVALVGGFYLAGINGAESVGGGHDDGSGCGWPSRTRWCRSPPSTWPRTT